MANNLEILKQNKSALLLAEVAAWLHDWRKCSDDFLSLSRDVRQLSHTWLDDFSIVRSPVSLIGDSCSLKDLIEIGRRGNPQEPGVILIARTLRRCHHAAHMEKEKGESDKSGLQPPDGTRPSSPFGYEAAPLAGLTASLKLLLNHGIQDRSTFRRAVRNAFRNALGDTRRPVNEVTLWDWSSTVAALYKAALAGMLLEGTDFTANPYDLRWRLLSVQLDGASFTERVARIPDLLARRKLLTDGLDRVQTLMEEIYPLGTEVYRDENGSLFVVPDMERLLELEDSSKQLNLSQLILNEFGKGTIDERSALQLNGEILPVPVLDLQAWAGSWSEPAPQPAPSIIVPRVSDYFVSNRTSLPDHRRVGDWWSNKPQADVCPVCGLRPQGPGEKAKQRKVCDVCERRRENRAKEWAANLDTTIWTDEVADQNGRLALIVGRLGIEQWLKPDGLIQTLFVEPPNASAGQPGIVKNSSFARLRRVWDTTRQFWEEIEGNFNQTVGVIGSRLSVQGAFEGGAAAERLSVSHTYELVVGNCRLSLVYINESKFLTAENLLRLARLLNAPEESCTDCSAAATYVRQRLIENGPFAVEEPTGYGSPNKLIGTFRISSVEQEFTSYSPAISLLTEPRIFMALVPADSAMNVAKAITKKYVGEMGKVRNRLPLTMGIIFSGSRTPMTAILDAGRRMLKQLVNEEPWTLHADAQTCGHDCVVTFTNGITWRVRIQMKDRSTEDVWYPYFLVRGVPTDRQRMRHIPGGRWLVHVSELKKGDTVCVLPSRFDFEWLDTTARRFEVSYADDGRRRGERSSRPYYLEALTEFEELWRLLKEQLATSQIQNIHYLIEAKRSEWGVEPTRLGFASYVRDVLANANWKHGAPTQMERLVAAALSGLLSDVIELYMKILKQKSERDIEETSL